VHSAIKTVIGLIFYKSFSNYLNTHKYLLSSIMSRFIVLMVLVSLCCSFLVSANSSFLSIKRYVCTPKDREGDICPLVVDPVCGYRPELVCITTPCNYVTYNNACEACHDEFVVSYTQGKCRKTN
jgi:hypothetical protein